MMRQVSFAQSAQTDLLEIWLYIAEENVGAADRVLDTLEQEANTLATQQIVIMKKFRPSDLTFARPSQ